MAGGAGSGVDQPPLDEKPSHPAVLVVPVPDADSESPLRTVPRAEAAAEDTAGVGEKGGKEGETRVTVPGLFTVLDMNSKFLLLRKARQTKVLVAIGLWLHRF